LRTSPAEVDARLGLSYKASPPLSSKQLRPLHPVPSSSFYATMAILASAFLL